jgi:dihydroorotase
MKILLKGGTLVNEHKVFPADIVIEGAIIEGVYPQGAPDAPYAHIHHLQGKHVFPGLIDDQVHFREPGLTHKGDLFTESRAAVAGGITSFMEMPNTVPSAVTQVLLEEKYIRASEVSLANYSFYMGTTNRNLDELLKTNPETVCGVKIFMGSSTGDMLVDDPVALHAIFREVKMLIAVHCEDDPMIKSTMARYKQQFGDAIMPAHHPQIRSREACYKSSSYAVELASKYNTRLHILHISTLEELSLFSNKKPLSEKRITSEACIHHLFFSDRDYAAKGNLIKWNPAVKTEADREAIIDAVNRDVIDVIATDHAPHTLQEKSMPYVNCPSGGPLVQHVLPALLELYHRNAFSLETIADKTSHKPAELFGIEKRGYIRKGYYADLVIADINGTTDVKKENLLYKCEWSPFEGISLRGKILHTFVNGNHVYDNGVIIDQTRGMRLAFARK